MTDTVTTIQHPKPSPTGYTVRVRYFAGARAAAGVAEEDVRLGGGPHDQPATVHAVLTRVRADRDATHGAELDRVLARCSFLLNGVAVHDHTTTVPDQAELDVLPPFAGG